MLRAKRRKKPQQSDNKTFRINYRIRVPSVIVIDETGQHLGEMPTAKALAVAAEKELDLVEVSPKAQPPVCKIINYGQFQYQQSRKTQAQKAQSKQLEIKVIRISFKIGKHDLELKQKQTQKFLIKGHKVCVEMILRGRERQHRTRAFEMLNSFINTISEEIIIEQPVKALGSKLSSLISLNK